MMGKTNLLQRFANRVFDEAALISPGIDRNLQIQVEPGRLRFCFREWPGREHDRRDSFFRAVEIITTAPVVVSEAIPGVFA